MLGNVGYIFVKGFIAKERYVFYRIVLHVNTYAYFFSTYTYTYYFSCQCVSAYIQHYKCLVDLLPDGTSSLNL